MLLERPELADIGIERRFCRDAFGLAFGADAALVEPARQMPEPVAFLAVAPHQFDLVGALQVGNQAIAVIGELGGGDRANTVDETDRLGAEEFHGFRLAQHGKAARLVHVGSDLGEEFVGRQADRDGDADVALDVLGKPRQHLGGAHAMQAFGAGQIEEGFVDRQRLDQRREVEHRLAHGAAGRDIFLHIGLDDDGIRAFGQRLEHRHGRADAEGARDIAASGDHATFAAADDHRFVGKTRVVALFDCGVEGVAVDMRDGQRGGFRVAHEARGAAGNAALCRVGRIRQAIAAEAHGTSRSQLPPPSAARATPIWAGSIPASVANSVTIFSLPAT